MGLKEIELSAEGGGGRLRWPLNELENLHFDYEEDIHVSYKNELHMKRMTTDTNWQSSCTNCVVSYPRRSGCIAKSVHLKFTHGMLTLDELLESSTKFYYWSMHSELVCVDITYDIVQFKTFLHTLNN